MAQPKVYHIGDPELVRRIKNLTVTEAKVVDQNGNVVPGLKTKSYRFREALLVQLSKFRPGSSGGLNVPFGLKEINFRAELATLCFSSTNEIDSMYEWFREYYGRFCENNEQRIDPRYFFVKVREGRSKFYSFGEDEKMVQIPWTEVTPGVKAVPVVKLLGFYCSGNRFGITMEVCDCFIVPVEGRRHLFTLEEKTESSLPVVAPPSDSEICAVCLDQRVAIVFQCGHFCTCSECSRRCQTCPICRARITQKINWRAITEEMMLTVFRV